MSAVYWSDVKNIAKTLVNSDGTNWVDIYDNSTVLDTKAVRVEGLSITSDDGSPVNIQFGLHNGSDTFPLGTVRVAALAGTDGATSRVIALGAGTLGLLAPDGIYDLWIEAGAKLQAKSLVAVTSNKTVTITGRVRTFA